MISPVTDTQTHTQKRLLRPTGGGTAWLLSSKWARLQCFSNQQATVTEVWRVLFCFVFILLTFLFFFFEKDKSLKRSWHGRKPYDYKDTVGMLGIGWQIFLFICSCWYPSVSQFASKCKEMNMVICDNCQSHHLYGSLTILVFITLFWKKNL